jgi:peptidoglycan-N-acetylglucosamine deacetylase
MAYLTGTELSRRRDAARRVRRRRRQFVGVTLLAAIAVLVAVLATAGASSNRQKQRSLVASVVPRQVVAARPRATLPHPKPLRVLPAKPGGAHVYLQGHPMREVALTFDDGVCAACAARIVHTLATTGAHATIFPNGRYTATWDPLAPAIRRLVANGQLTIGNHTFLHHDAREESAAAFQEDLANDESWVEHTFGVSARPFFRPPYGAYDAVTLSIAGSAGYTKVIMWSGTVADSTLQTVGYILAAIRHWARPGAIILMHANYPPTSFALPQILAILHQRGLRPVTLAQLLGA